MTRSTLDGLILVSAGAAAAALLAVVDPATSPVLPPCVWRTVTGWQCPGCGSARAIHALLHGDIEAAFRANALAVGSVPLVAADAIRRLTGLGWIAGSDIPSIYVRGLAAAIVLFGILRNL